ncbi:type I restriction-modification system endonuclease [Rhodoferax sp. TS-BS-61-7]|uniref:type I restriction-modification system endonuclease n=1 Tax=Rhodoferax sp. TS-BS-61-7 TaxID=2094194 RepID=UPI000CF6D338|nr:type I restriction-modification system endonuclease [Rhodoferax sp. TS-BS-61-7]PQA75803.1 type I restriction-modification system endonuclease [Rhodoferax sp. TS-BS-61-7]
MVQSSSNFHFLAQHSPLLADLGATAERLFPFDPASCVLKLRILAESLTQEMAARLGVRLQQPTQAELLRAVDSRLGLDPQVRQMFHLLRHRGNEAAHQADHAIGYREGLEALKVAREVALWFHRTFGQQPNFKPGPFVLPDDPSQKLHALQTQLAQLQQALQDAQAAQSNQAEVAQLLEAAAAQERAMAQRAQEERAIYEALATDASENYARLKAEFDQRIAQSPAQTEAAATQAFASKAAQAAQQVQMDEAATRLLIDQLLIDAGWDANTVHSTHAKGSRPEKGKNKAIAEWPTQGKQSADYILFAGLTPIAAVEAKRLNTNVAGKIPQAERYARGMQLAAEHQPAWATEGRAAPWPDGEGGNFQLPFVYSCNGRPLIKQSPEASGTWHRDVRQSANLRKVLPGFHSPQGLVDQLTRSRADAEARLAQESFAYLRLRDYQVKAISAVETALASGQTNCLLAMATGTGKTRTIIGLMYRFLKAERFRRILFLVDRTALGDQAMDNFNEAPLEQDQPLSKIYNIADLGDMAAEAETRVQVATVQAMVKRIFGSDNPPPLDAYDCIIVDEAHRGYTLDQDMTEGELTLRDPAQYLSSYRRVLDYFDAAKIGLTATPAQHTSEIFGKPVYTYSYREAVADDWLIDYEPPIRYETLLSKHGIHFAKGDTVESLNLSTGEIEAAELDDELHFEVESFNRRVINEDFNRIICEQLAQELDPLGEEKTMVFCATDAHADMVVRLLGQAFEGIYGEQYNQAAVQKITGASDKVDQLIRRYKNERFPSIAVTVDLLTTGIDVPAICHLVFLRRVKSRILYEQMIGRATRRCDDIGKTVFKIYDPVDLYATLQDVNTMQPLVKNPQVDMEQLLDELNNPAAYTAPGNAPGRSHAHDVLDELNQKLMRVLRSAQHKADKRPALKARLETLEQQWGVPPAQLHRHLHQLGRDHGPQAAADFLRHNTQLLTQLAEVRELMGTAYRPILSTHKDQFVAREQSWGDYYKPQDYLESFGQFVREQINQSAALAVVVNRPKDLTREQLKEVRLLLDGKGFSEARLQAAWRSQSNQDIAAGIMGYIRQAALGEALLPFDERVKQALQKLYATHPFTPVQRKWLDRLAKQLTHELVIDHTFVNQAFAQDGGAKQLDKLLGGQLDPVLGEITAYLWPQVA